MAVLRTNPNPEKLGTNKESDDAGLARLVTMKDLAGDAMGTARQLIGHRFIR